MNEHLSVRELQCLHHIAAGQSNVEIADALGLSVGTVSCFVVKLLAKLGATNRAEAVALGFRRGVLDLELAAEIEAGDVGAVAA